MTHGFGVVDIDENDNGWTVVASLPGVAPEEVTVEIEDRELRVRGKTASAADKAAFNYRLGLPGKVDPDRVDATMDHGLLTVRLPRATTTPRRDITVGRGGTATV